MDGGKNSQEGKGQRTFLPTLSSKNPPPGPASLPAEIVTSFDPIPWLATRGCVSRKFKQPANSVVIQWAYLALFLFVSSVVVVLFVVKYT